jgi:tRNA(fMet)-specific endonuclease VapC
MLRYLLDTTICIDVIKRRPQELLETFNRHAGQMALRHP